ncbi:MAG: hypothetical protein AB1742_00010 [bacterium]
MMEAIEKSKFSPDLRRRIEIVRAEMRSRIDEGIKYTDRMIENLHGGIVGIFVNRLALFIFAWLGRDRAREEGIREIDHAIYVAAQCVHDEGANLDDLIDKNFNGYLKHHPLYRRCDMDHPRFNDITALMREGLKTRADFYYQLLRRDAGCYEDLLKTAFPNKEDSMRVVDRQHEIVQEAFELVSREKELLKVPSIIRRDVLKIIRRTDDYGNSRLKKRINEIYGN